MNVEASPPPSSGGKSGSSRLWSWIIAVSAIAAGAGLFFLLQGQSGTARGANEAGDVNSQRQAILQRLEAVKPKGELTEVERNGLLAYGREIAMALTLANGKVTREMLDEEIFADRVCAKLQNIIRLQEVQRELVESLKSMEGGIFTEYLGCKSRFTHLGSRDGYPTVFIRTLDHKNGLRFFEALVSIKNEEMKVVDIYDYTFATYVSDEDARLVQYVTLPDELRQKKEGLAFARDELIRDMLIDLASGNLQQVIASYKGLPEKDQKEALFFRFYIQALMQERQPTDQTFKEYRQAMSHADKILGLENTSPLAYIDELLETGKYADAEQLVRRVEERVGPDAYLVTLRGKSVLKQGRIEDAEAIYKEGKELQSDLDVLAHFRRLIFAAKKQYQLLAMDLRELQEKTHRKLSHEALAAEPEFADFLKSKEFADLERENQIR